MTLRVYLAGEGASELGSRAGHPAYQTSDEPGVLESVLTRIQADGWKVARARQWKDFRKFRAGAKALRGSHNDERNVRAAALDATDAGCDVLVFSRDQDNDPERHRAVEAGIAEAANANPRLRIAGSVAVRCIEAWMLALLGNPRSEDLSVPAAARALQQAGCDGWRDMASRVAECDLAARAPDALSLDRWLDRVRGAFSG